MPEMSLLEQLEQLETKAIESFAQTKTSYHDGLADGFCFSEYEVRKWIATIEALPEPLSKADFLRMLRGEKTT